MLCKDDFAALGERLLQILGLQAPQVYYIGGSDTLPPPLSRHEEERAIAALAAGDEAARSQLIEHNLRLVVFLAKRFENTGVNLEDLISIGTIGLIKGINTYKADKGVKLSSYVSRCIENEILMNFRGKRKREGDVSLSEALDVEEEGDSLSYLDVLTCQEDLDERIGTKEICRRLRDAVENTLSDREAALIRLRYGLDGTEGMTQRQVAQSLSISRSYVSRIEKKALEKLRKALGEDAYPT